MTSSPFVVEQRHLLVAVQFVVVAVDVDVVSSLVVESGNTYYTETFGTVVTFAYALERRAHLGLLVVNFEWELSFDEVTEGKATVGVAKAVNG